MATESTALGVTQVRLSLVNAYLVGDQTAGDRGWVLIDAALPTSGRAITRAAAERFGANSRPAAVLLTHGHFDHVGALRELADQWDAPVFAHEMELPYLTGGSAYPPPDPSVGGGMAFMSRLFPAGPFDFGSRMRALPADGSVPGLPGWRWVFTPGHSPGHVSFFRESDRTLIVGDAFVTQKQESLFGALLREPHEVRRPPAYFTPDWGAARRSVEALAALRPEVAATGHGLPIAGDELRRGLDDLIRNWDREAVPNGGRYADRPAVTDRRGTVSVPPPVFDPQLAAAVGVGVAVTAGVLLRGGSARTSHI